jgi:hypothetical protein
MAYATVAELAAHLGLSDAITPSGVMVDAARNARYQLALDVASTAIETDCGRVFTSASATKTLISKGGYVLPVPDLVSATTIKTDEDDDGIFETTLLAVDYELGSWNELRTDWPYEWVNRIDDQWPIPTPGGRRKLIEITGTWGWSSVPNPIKQACLLMAARQVARGNASLGVQGVSDFGPFSIRSTDPDYQALIGPYKIVGVA